MGPRPKETSPKPATHASEVSDMASSRFSFLTEALSARLSRRAALAGIPAAALAPGAVSNAQAGAQAGTAPAGENAFEFVGVVQQLGLDFTLTAYLTHLAGVDRALLFDGADPLARSETTARLMMSASATGVTRSILENIFVVNGEGTVGFYLGGPGASFGDPAAFSAGTQVASGSVAIQDVLNVQAPQVGIASGNGTLTIDTTTPFTLGDTEITIAAPGTRYRLWFTGQATLEDPATLQAFVLVAGNGVVAG
jgi:hypothetical protein